MVLEIEFPEIILDNDLSFNEGYYKEGIKEILRKILPSDLFYKENDKWMLSKSSFFNDSLPIINKHALHTNPNSIAISLLYKYRQNANRFFYDMISRWLIPNKKINIGLFFSSNFTFTDFDSYKLSVAQIIVKLDNENEVKEVNNNFRSIETEIRLGVISDFHANRIMEFKGFSSDRKIEMIQESIGNLIKNRPKDFGQSIFSHMQHFLVTCREEFKSIRDHNHISRIISILHSMRKLLQTKIETDPNKRHLILRFLKTKLKITNSERSVLGLLVGLNFLKQHEIFEKSHLLKAIRRYFPKVVPVENSYIIDRNRNNTVQTIYLEIEKENEEEFTFDEIQNLRFSLSNDLKGYVEQLMHSIFMPRNEEEIVRNIMALSRQLKYVQDIPQVIISFDQQTSSELTYTVILLRILKDNPMTVKDMFTQSNSEFRFLSDRIKKVGILRRKHIKEANVFRLVFPINPYFRSDNSVDLNKARFDVLMELNRIFDDVRDYNGGMIQKQKEVLSSLKLLLDEVGTKNENFLEKFFYSITPAEMTVIQNKDYLRNMFLFLLKIKNERMKKPNRWICSREGKTSYIVISDVEQLKKKALMDKIEKLYLPSSEFLYFYLSDLDINYLGFILFSDDSERQKAFLKIVRDFIEFRKKI